MDVDWSVLCQRSSFLTPTSCWITGAGASYDCLGNEKPCVPLTTGLLSCIDSLGSHITGPLVSSLHRLRQQGVVAFESIEQALAADLERTIDQLRGAATRQSDEFAKDANECLRKLVEAVARAIASSQFPAFIADGPGGEYRAWNYFWLAAACGQYPDWSVMTLNYDMVFDWGLRFFKKSGFHPWPIQYDNWLAIMDAHIHGKPESNTQRGLYLKLHGSLLLYTCLNSECSHYRTPFRYADDLQKFTMDIAPSGECPACKERESYLILPPGRNKTPEESVFHERMYSHARQVLSKANSWIVLGYSVPTYDEDVIRIMRDALLATTVRPTIIVVAPDATDISLRLSDRIEYPVDSLCMTFSQLVKDLCGLMEMQSPAEMADEME